jgi:hypothetical protein
MADKQSLNQLLQWSIENSVPTQNGEPTAATAPPRDPSRGLDAKMLAELLGGPSDADRMKDAMHAIVAPMDKVDLENKLIAWDNLEQLIEQIDNANNMVPLGLWEPLLKQLDHDDSAMRAHAAACVKTAVQNNVKAQEHALGTGVIPILARLATEDSNPQVRKKAIGALSCHIRNFQPGIEELEKSLPESIWKPSRGGQDAGDMDSCDEIIQKLRDHSASRG